MTNQEPNQQDIDRRGPGDPYRVLGLAPGATSDQINAAYRRALRRLHPDTAHPNPDTGAVTGEVAGGLTVADVQHARWDLLRAEQRRRTEQRPRAGQPRAGGDEAGMVGSDRVIPRAGAAGRCELPSGPRPHAWRPGVGEPDIICGPVRYHGPPGRSR
jgi:DnaJ domain